MGCLFSLASYGAIDIAKEIKTPPTMRYGKIMAEREVGRDGNMDTR